MLPDGDPSLVRPSAEPPRLSKSRYLSGLQCERRLYLEIRSPQLATPPDDQTLAVMSMGTAIGVVARRRFPGGVLVDVGPGRTGDALRRTSEILEDPAVPAIFEGAFAFDGVVVRVDVLERVRDGLAGPPTWRLIEVKSSSRVKDVHLDDLAVQAHVLEGAGIPLAGAFLLHVNTGYLYDGTALDVDGLLVCDDVTDVVSARRATVGASLTAFTRVLHHDSPPPIEPGGHCHAPYECPFWAHCTREKPGRWIGYFPGGSKGVARLAARGIRTIDEIPPDVRLTPMQHRVKNNVEWIGPELARALRTVRYPVHHLDFETFMPAIPKFPGTRPYQTIPMQWSIHTEEEAGSVRHREYLCAEARDPRTELAEALLGVLGTAGSICIYSQYDRVVIEQLAEAVPDLRRNLLALVRRLCDLHSVVRDHYYHPAFEGSTSIKVVAKALVPSLAYTDLAIRDGGAAAASYERMVFEETDWVEKERIREALLRYCARDTLVLLEVRRALLAKAPTPATTA